jgi:hypothetical protein
MWPTNLPEGGFNLRFRIISHVFILLCIAASAGVTLLNLSSAADHNDPNAVNSIFSDIDVSAADLYDIFGWPADDTTGGEKVVIALTFASVPKTGVFDSDMLYRILIAPTPRDAPQLKDDDGLEVVLRYFEAIKNKYVSLQPAEVRVTVDQEGRAKINFIGFPAGAFVRVIDTNKVVTIDAPGGSSLKAYIGGRDDAFFNDLPGFFRSINYAPQFYRVPHTMTDPRELKIPKTLIELEGNKLFNFDPANPKHGQGVKLDLPSVPLTWDGNKYFKDKNGNYRFVYSGNDAQAGMNINAIILEMPLAFLRNHLKWTASSTPGVRVGSSKRPARSRRFPTTALRLKALSCCSIRGLSAAWQSRWARCYFFGGSRGGRSSRPVPGSIFLWASCSWC